MPMDLDNAKEQVIERIAGDKEFYRLESDVWQIGDQRVHIKGKSNPEYAFNINRAVLRNNFEVWVCGGPELYYLIPVSVIRQMYAHPEAYPDNTHPGLTVVSVDRFADVATYARNATSLSLKDYRCATL